MTFEDDGQDKPPLGGCFSDSGGHWPPARWLVPDRRSQRTLGSALGAIACLSMGLWIRRAPRISPTSGWVLVIAIGFFATAVALVGFAVRDGINGDVGGLLINLVGAGAAIYVGVRGIGKARALRRAQRQT